MEKIMARFYKFTPSTQMVVLLILLSLVSILVARFTGRFKDQPVPVHTPVTQAAMTEQANVNRINNDVMDLCESVVSQRATNRSSVKFLGNVSGQRVRQMADGRLEVNTRFSAKNGYGAESISTAKCITSQDGRKLTDISIEDSR